VVDAAGAAVAAAVEVAGRLGLAADRPAVLRHVSTTLVHLAPSTVVARVWPAGHRDPAAVRNELAMTAYLAARGAPVVAPYAGGDAGPHVARGHSVTLWGFVDHDPERLLDGREAGRGLRAIHELLSDDDAPDLTGLPHVVRLAETADLVAGLDLTRGDRADVEELLARAATVLDGMGHLPVQPLHGDAWLGNVLRTSEGPVWTDFERVCHGPREADLAAQQAVSRHRGRAPVDEELLEGYGEVDRDLVAAWVPLAVVPVIGWTFRLAGRRPEYLDAARSRLALALEDLRGPGADGYCVTR
jgi:Ser/Thr protein kinase RdoA (MazF antagonist)